MREPGHELDDLAHRVIGAAIAVHRELGPGYLEAVYEEALAIELRHEGIAFERQKPIPLVYRGQTLAKSHRLDLLIENKLIVELKACERFEPIHQATVLSYLKATGLELGLLINFQVPVLKDGLKRIIRTR
ncbi:MAG: GxxExxY protein [Planctomycetota bacterium]